MISIELIFNMSKRHMDVAIYCTLRKKNILTEKTGPPPALL